MNLKLHHRLYKVKKLSSGNNACFGCVAYGTLDTCLAVRAAYFSKTGSNCFGNVIFKDRPRFFHKKEQWFLEAKLDQDKEAYSLLHNYMRAVDQALSDPCCISNPHVAIVKSYGRELKRVIKLN